MPSVRDHVTAAVKDSAKLTKAEVNYSPGKPAEHCGNCTHYEPPNACSLVRGDIDPGYWCEKWEAKDGR